MAIYHGFNALNDAHTFIVLNPSLTFQHHMKQARDRDPQAMRWQDFHLAVVYSMTFRWREYVDQLEASFDKTVSLSFTTVNTRPSHNLTAKQVIHGLQEIRYSCQWCSPENINKPGNRPQSTSHRVGGLLYFIR